MTDDSTSRGTNSNRKIKSSELAKICAVWGSMETFFPPALAPRVGARTNDEAQWKAQPLAKPSKFSVRMGEELVPCSEKIRDPAVAKALILEAYKIRRSGKGKGNVNEPGIRPRDVKAALATFNTRSQTKDNGSAQNQEPNERVETEDSGTERTKSPERVSPNSPRSSSVESESRQSSQPPPSRAGRTHHENQRTPRRGRTASPGEQNEAPRKRQRLAPDEETFKTGYYIDRKKSSAFRMNSRMSESDVSKAQQEVDREIERNYYRTQKLEARYNRHRTDEDIYESLQEALDLESTLLMLRIKKAKMDYESEQDQMKP